MFWLRVKYFFLLVATWPSLIAAAQNGNKTQTVHINDVWEYFLKHSESKNRDDSVPSSYRHYDKSGQLIHEVLYDNDGSAVRETKWKYDARGNKIEESQYDGSGVLHERMTYKYNNKDSIVEEAVYERGNELEKKKTYKYNKRGQMEMITQENEAGMIGKTIFSYDNHGNLLSMKDYDSRDSIMTGYEYKYDNNNNRIEEIRYDRKGQEWKFLYSYTPFDKKERETHEYNYKTSNSTMEWRYDKQQHLTEEITYDYTNKVIQKKSYTWQNGLLKSEEANKGVTDFFYDSLGQKIKEKVFVGTKQLSEKIYDKAMNMVTWIHYSPPGSLSFTESFEYDVLTPARLIKTTKTGKDKNIIEQTEIKYDKNGNPIDELRRGEDLVSGEPGVRVLSHKVWVNRYY